MRGASRGCFVWVKAAFTLRYFAYVMHIVVKKIIFNKNS